jgi:hypothetical protein
MKRVSTMPRPPRASQTTDSSIVPRRKSVAVLTKFMSNAEERMGMTSTIGYRLNRR